MRASTSAGSAPPFSASFVEALPHRGEAALDRSGRGVVERDPAARRRDDLRDPAAHLAGADDEHVLELHAGQAIVVACPTSTSTAQGSGSKSAERALSSSSFTAALAIRASGSLRPARSPTSFRTIRFDLRFYGRSESPGTRGTAAAPRPNTVDRLGEIRAPTLVVVATHDPARAAGGRPASCARDPGRIRPPRSIQTITSTLRAPEEVAELLVEFLASAAPQ